MMNAEQVAQILLKIQAVHLDPVNYFTWTSGIKSPIYCDNRQIISYDKYRTQISNTFAKYIQTHHPKTQVIAGTATAGIPWASWIAQKCKLPLVYVRGGSKGHGLKNQIEGKLAPKSKVILIEDLISTGKSSIEAAKAIQEQQSIVTKVLAIFSYEFEQVPLAFKASGLKFHALSNLNSLLSVAVKQGLITAQQSKEIKTWKKTITL